MIFSSSSGDHLDCFLAGDSDGCTPWCLFAGTLPAADRGVDSAVVDAATVVGTDAERDEAGAEVVDRASSSSFGLRSSEISTLSGCERKQSGAIGGLCQLQSIGAASKKNPTPLPKGDSGRAGRQTTSSRDAIRMFEGSGRYGTECMSQ